MGHTRRWNPTVSRSKRNSPLSRLMQIIRRWFNRKPDPQEPYAGVRAPLRKGPNDRSSAIALAEPDE